MKNDEIRQANRKALPKFLLFAVVCTIVGGVSGYYSGYGAAKGGIDKLVGIMKETGAFFGTHIAPWLMLALAVIVLVQQVEGNFVSPHFTASGTSLHPLAALVSVFVLGSLFGLWGILLAIPVVVTLRSAIWSARQMTALTN